MSRPAMAGLAARLLVGTCLLATAIPVAAQDSRENEVVVTATRRARPIQDIPVAVTAITSEQLTRGSVTDIRTLMSQTPSLVTTTSGSPAGGTTARIRGIGTTGDNSGLESAVGVFIDGVYRNRNNVALGDLGEVERIEVLRGPQGTLFGRNTSAGLLSITTKGPRFEPTYSADASYGNYDFYRFAGSATGPVIDDLLALRIDANYTSREGFTENVLSGQDYNDRDRYLIRAQALYTPTNEIDVRIILDYAESTEQCCAAVQIRQNRTSQIFRDLGAVLPSDIEELDVSVNDDIGYQTDIEQYGISAELNWDLGFGNLTSITAYRDWEATRSQDADFSNLRLIHRPEDSLITGFETFTQEVRLQGEFGQLDYLVGVFYSDEDLISRDRLLFDSQFEEYWSRRFLGAATPPGGRSGYANLLQLPGTPGSATGAFPTNSGIQRDAYDQNAESIAVFTHNTFNLTEELSLTGGIRFTSEEKTLDANLLTNSRGCVRGAALTGRLPANAGAIPGVLPEDVALAPLPAGVARTTLNALLPGTLCLGTGNALINGIYANEREENELSGIASIAYSFSEGQLPEDIRDLLVYFTYSRGYKAGGFNLAREPAGSGLAGSITRAQADFSFDPEFVDAYELGVKSVLLDGAVVLNVTGFYQELSDFQLNAFNGLFFTVSNLPQVKSTGVETEITAFPTDELTVRLNAAWTDARYGDELTPATAGIRGRRLTNSALWVVTGGFSYDRVLTFGEGAELPFFIQMDGRYSSDVNTGSDLNPLKTQQDIFLVNARVGISSPDDRFSFELFATNLLDRRYNQIIFDSVLQEAGALSSFPSEPGFYGATLRARF